MITTVDEIDRNRAVYMLKYYCDMTGNLSMLKKVLADGGYTGKKFADLIKSISEAEVDAVK